jgi:Fe-Mn family superoxide dismutase
MVGKRLTVPAMLTHSVVGGFSRFLPRKILVDCVIRRNVGFLEGGEIMFRLPDLPYDYSALEPYIDEQTMRLHHGKHHAGYVDKLNITLEGKQELLNLDISKLLRDLSRVPEEIRTAVRNNGGGHANHSLFWRTMGPGKGGGPEGNLRDAINSAFGDFARFKESFIQAGLGRFGSGWAWLIVDNGQLKVIDTPNQDTPLSEGKTPILALDVWEHAYYLKYQNRRAEYIESWWNVVNWQEVSRRYDAVTK